MSHPLIRQMEQHDTLSEDERQIIRDLTSHSIDVTADADIVREGDRPTDSNLLLQGFACRYKLFPDGRRQITALHVAGDFVDLHAFLLKKMDHGVTALSPCKLALVPHDKLRQVTETQPHLTRLLWLSTLVDASIHREWMTGMGRRSAAANLAHLLCELRLRLATVGLADGDTFELPVTQAELGDALGLSTVHVNRVIQELRGDNLITWRGATVVIDDLEGLKDVAGFDPGYLYVGDHEPR